jgi:hypothetical protein
MAFIAAPYIVSTLGASIPVIGEYVTDVLAFTGAGIIINDVVDFVEKQTEDKPEDKSKEGLDITPEPADIRNLYHSINGSTPPDMVARQKALISRLKSGL